MHDLTLPHLKLQLPVSLTLSIYLSTFLPTVSVSNGSIAVFLSQHALPPSFASSLHLDTLHSSFLEVMNVNTTPGQELIPVVFHELPHSSLKRTLLFPLFPRGSLFSIDANTLPQISLACSLIFILGRLKYIAT